ncbi:M20/M25/M40 family metallo-hydrolase [Labrys sp. KNU-23]|uniref:M20/M25/M40 family metallo-hydrolase n=1 Tax=Labrys sp. KNU-23 TaxID=2789216 RepID=UPI0011EC9A80|nr:M20/M25/M40 family metallo-hydrolase [Labrys sp. KNU-23]QEN88178.1 M20/M25/M40 family metallo-hydrolase [Labrys sp. KNU-23]
MHRCSRSRAFAFAVVTAALSALAIQAQASPAMAAPQEAVLKQAEAQRQPLIDTMKALVSIESGSKDPEGLAEIAALIADRLKALGGEVQQIEPKDVYRMQDTPEKLGRVVLARFTGTGTRKIALIAHMDTVYLKGMLAQQPFRIDGDKAYGLGIADDKHGVALALTTVALLKELNFKDYGTLTVMINGDEEISSPAARSLLTEIGAEQDAVFSLEGGGTGTDKITLATAGIGAVALKVEGKASHAGAAPERGINALYELAHQILQMRDLSDPKLGLKLNWTVAKAGTNRNVIPAEATAQADVRMLRMDDFDRIEKTVKERIARKLLPDSKIEAVFERRRPPLEPTDAGRALAAQASAIYGEIGQKLTVIDKASGGGTDAAFAALKAKGPVIEGLGLRGFGAHSNDAEYVELDSVVPRLYLLARLIMEVSAGKAK